VLWPEFEYVHPTAGRRRRVALSTSAPTNFAAGERSADSATSCGWHSDSDRMFSGWTPECNVESAVEEVFERRTVEEAVRHATSGRDLVRYLLNANTKSTSMVRRSAAIDFSSSADCRGQQPSVRSRSYPLVLRWTLRVRRFNTSRAPLTALQRSAHRCQTLLVLFEAVQSSCASFLSVRPPIRLRHLFYAPSAWIRSRQPSAS
jgi:hypothetical protein